MSGVTAHINIQELDFSFKEKIILSNLNLQLKEGQRLFIVGENGIGKSTLLNIIAGKIRPPQCTFKIKGSIGYLPQSFGEYRNRTSIEHLIKESKQPHFLELFHKNENVRYDEWKDDFIALGGHHFLAVLNKLNFPQLDLNRKFDTLSGGEKTKLQLAALDFLQPDILLLDEPTNHLDERGLKWLESFLTNYPGAVITVTHDRSLINSTANYISELSAASKNLIHFKGSYQNYLEQQNKIREKYQQLRKTQTQQLHQLKKKSQEVTTHNFTAIRRMPTDSNKLGFNARGQRRQKEQKRITKQISGKIKNLLENFVEVPAERTKIEVLLPSSLSTYSTVIDVKNISKSFNNVALFSNLNLSISNNERVVINGINGCGKTTLLKIISGILKPDTGSFHLAPDTNIGYLSQEPDNLDDAKSPFQILFESFSSSYNKEEIIKHLYKFGIIYAEDLFSPLGNLSLGCKRKVQLACFYLKGANVLLLDEPTNHIDFLSLEAIENELMNYPGAILAISHDRYFTKKIGTRIINFESLCQRSNEHSKVNFIAP